MRRKQLGAALAACLIGTSLLAGCSDTQGDVGNRNIRPNSVRIDGNGNRVIDKRFANDQFNEMNRVYGRRLNSNNVIGLHQNYRMELSQDIADRLNGTAGIQSSYVILTDKNAYVAVTTSGKGNAGVGKEGTRMQARSVPNSTGMLGYPRMYEAPDVERDTEPLEHGMGLRSSRTDSRAGINEDVQGQGLTAYSANDNRAGTGTTKSGKSGMHEQVASIVREMAPQIEQLYISSEPEFVDRMSSYTQEASRGESIQGYIAEFNAMVDRIFPVRSGIRIAGVERSQAGDSWVHD